MPEETIPLRKSDSLLQIARCVFGANIIVCVWIATFDYGNSEPGEVEQRLSDSLKRVSLLNDDSDNKIFQYDCDTIWIEFVNGHVVRFNASEWASVSVAKTEISRDA